MFKRFKLIPGRLQRMVWIFVDKIFNVDFSIQENTTKEGHDEYSPTGLGRIISILKYLYSEHVGKNDAIIDVGCGKGRVLCFFSLLPFGRIAGIEYERNVALAARVNTKKLNLKRISIYAKDATQFEEYGRFNYIYMYNPFDATIMSKFIEKVKDAYRNNGEKDLHIIYATPKYHSMLINAGFRFEKNLGRGIFAYVYHKNFTREEPEGNQY